MRDVEARSYKAWHRHMLFVMMAHLFTQMLRIHFKKTTTAQLTNRIFLSFVKYIRDNHFME